MSIVRFLRLFAISLGATIAAAAAQATELTWYGHAAFKIVTPAGRVVFIDPWIANPANPAGKEDLAKVDKADLVLVTHGHGDHIGNAVEIGNKTGAQLVAVFDLAKAMVQYRGYPEKQAGMATVGNFGGEISLLDGDVRVAFVPAIHGSTVETAGMPEEGSLEAAGQPGGFLVTVKDGPVIYHAGDTDVFGDMALIGTFRPVDVMLAPIGDKFTMGPARAAIAARLVNPSKAIIPMHYGTFPVLTGTPAAFSEALAKEGVAAPMREMKPGETAKF